MKLFFQEFCKFDLEEGKSSQMKKNPDRIEPNWKSCITTFIQPNFLSPFQKKKSPKQGKINQIKFFAQKLFPRKFAKK